MTSSRPSVRPSALPSDALSASPPQRRRLITKLLPPPRRGCKIAAHLGSYAGVSRNETLRSAADSLSYLFFSSFILDVNMLVGKTESRNMCLQPNSTFICHPAAGPTVQQDRLFQTCLPICTTVCLEFATTSVQRLCLFLNLLDLKLFIHSGFH